MAPQGGDRASAGTRVGDALERLVFSGWYQWIVRGLLAALAVLAVVHAARFGGASVLSGPAVRALTLVTSVAVAAFVVAGVVQLVLVVRGIRRREAVVAESAETVEESAADVERAAEELEGAIEEGELDASAPEGADERVERVEERVQEAEEGANEARETVEEVADELEAPDDGREDGRSA